MKSPEEELFYLREKVRESGNELGIQGYGFESGRLARREIEEYASVPAQELLHEAAVLPEHEVVRHALRLLAHDSDGQIDALLKILATHGFRNALSIVMRAKNPDLEGDFAAILARIVAEGLPEKGFISAEGVKHSPDLVLFEVQPTGHGKFEVAVALSERIYSELSSVIERHESFSLEIASPLRRAGASMYLSVPRAKRTLAERLINSISPHILISECRGDYNIFDSEREIAAAYAALSDHHAFPLSTHEAFSEDPMNSLFEAFSRVGKYGESAAMQFVIGNEEERYRAHYKKMLSELGRGRSLSEVLELPESFPGTVLRKMLRVYGNVSEAGASPHEEAALPIERKIRSPVVPVLVRIAAGARDKERAQEILDSLKASFYPYSAPCGNELIFADVGNWDMRGFLRDFSMRKFRHSSRMPLNLAEVATMMHFA